MMILDFEKTNSDTPVAMSKIFEKELRFVLFLQKIPKMGYFFKLGKVNISAPYGTINPDYGYFIEKMIDCLLNDGEILESEAYKNRVRAMFDELVKKYDLIPFDWDTFADYEK